MESKIGPSEAISQMRSVDPAMDASWVDLSREWEPEPPLPILTFAEFARAVGPITDQGTRVQTVLGLVEDLLVGGDPEVQEMVRTGFIEAWVDMPQADSRKWIALLGPESRTYADAWNAFCGVRAPRGWLDGMVERHGTTKVAVAYSVFGLLLGCVSVVLLRSAGSRLPWVPVALPVIGVAASMYSRSGRGARRALLA